MPLLAPRNNCQWDQAARNIWHWGDESSTTVARASSACWKQFTVHCMLTGILIETVLEGAGFNARVYTRHLKKQVLEVLY